MHRLFVAVVPPPVVRDRLLDAMGGIAGARWQRDDQLHMTLRFIGEVDRNAANDVAAALTGLHHPAFDVEIGEVGIFDTRGRTNAIWIGVHLPTPLPRCTTKSTRGCSAPESPPTGARSIRISPSRGSVEIQVPTLTLSHSAA